MWSEQVGRDSFLFLASIADECPGVEELLELLTDHDHYYYDPVCGPDF